MHEADSPHLVRGETKKEFVTPVQSEASAATIGLETRAEESTWVTAKRGNFATEKLFFKIISYMRMV